MKRQYILTYVALLFVAWTGWRALATPQSPNQLPTPESGSGLQLPAPVAKVTAPPADLPSLAAKSIAPVASKAEPSIRLEWLGPTNVRIGQPNDYVLLVRNTSDAVVTDVRVKVQAVLKSVVAAAPQPRLDDGAYLWSIGTMQPKQEHQIQLRMIQNDKGSSGAAATVSLASSAAMQIRVSEPQLVVRTTGPARCLLGEGAGFVVSVSNPGDGIAERVKLCAELTEGLEHGKGQLLNYEVGNLNPGETRTVQVLTVARGDGSQTCQATAEADGGLKSADKTVVAVVSPRLDIAVNGPKLRYLDRKAVFNIKVTNPGEAPATNVVITDALPAGFKFVSADNGGRHDFAARTVSWFVGELAPGQSQEVNVELQAANPGDFSHRVVALGGRGLKSEAMYPTKVEGLAAILLEVVDVEDPIEVNGETTYEIKITNTGTKTETDLKLVCSLPPTMRLKSVAGPTACGQQGVDLYFAALPRLAPRADAVYRITVKATETGVAYFKAQVTSTLLVEPVSKTEATRIYSD